mmetsp:Transcript_16220/g.39642  ORF Transcript_16220/g.39642 Transcript_16220/m.39642 type:complete len:80 (-) Transcript_16220:280-519(-)
MSRSVAAPEPDKGSPEMPIRGETVFQKEPEITLSGFFEAPKAAKSNDIPSNQLQRLLNLLESLLASTGFPSILACFHLF